MTMKTYNVYVEDTNGNYHSDYTVEAESEALAYDIAYERHNYADMTIYVDLDDEAQPSTMLQDAYFEGKHPLEAFPSLKWGSK
jgi:hypothetical protein